jgi:hypothetical protein
MLANLVDEVASDQSLQGLELYTTLENLGTLSDKCKNCEIFSRVRNFSEKIESRVDEKITNMLLDSFTCTDRETKPKYEKYLATLMILKFPEKLRYRPNDSPFGG